MNYANLSAMETWANYSTFLKPHYVLGTFEKKQKQKLSLARTIIKCLKECLPQSKKSINGHDDYHCCNVQAILIFQMAFRLILFITR